jgi:hypothetical protein
MTPDDIQKYIHDGVEAALKSQLAPAIQTAVDTAVNGKIKALDAKVSPMVDAYGKWLSVRRNAFVIIGVFIAIGSVVQTVETLWTIVTNYLTFGVK